MTELRQKLPIRRMRYIKTIRTEVGHCEQWIDLNTYQKYYRIRGVMVPKSHILRHIESLRDRVDFEVIRR